MTDFIWPSDAARAESDELNRVCEHLEEVLDALDEAEGGLRAVRANRNRLVGKLLGRKQERDALAAHQADLVRELSACQSVLFSLAHDGKVTPEYASDAKSVLKRTEAVSLARRDARVAADAIGTAAEAMAMGGHQPWVIKDMRDLERAHRRKAGETK